MRIVYLACAAIAAVGFASAAQATITFDGSYTLADNTSDPGLVLVNSDVTPGLGTGFTFDLTNVGDMAIVPLFDLYTNEDAINGDDLHKKPITLSFSFSQPLPNSGGDASGFTGGYDLIIANGGFVTWSDGGNGTIDFGNGGELGFHLDNATFNNGVFAPNPGYDQRANIAAEFTLNKLSAAVPEPTTWALMIMGFAGIGATLRRRRQQPALAS